MDPIAKLTAGFRVIRDGRFQVQRATYEALVDQGQKPKVALIAGRIPGALRPQGRAAARLIRNRTPMKKWTLQQGNNRGRK